MIDTRKLETELARIFRCHGIHTTGYHGVQHVGICSTEDTENGVVAPTMPRTAVVSLATLAQEIAECMA